ncbi:MAG: aldo/keto reductase [Acidimicrobiia bacterium]|nr:aldo/keto reductase [Acidimicrobiia bacterium]MYC44497.1 aldo/keto reductase [Acidimicrobiia bacterium]
MRTRPVGRTALQVTELGFGGAGLGELFELVSEPDAQATLEAAWSAGVRYFDTAPWYGHGLSEHRIGHFLRQKSRADYVLSTKVGRVYTAKGRESTYDGAPWVGGLDFELRFDYTRSGILRSYEDSLQRFGISRVDILNVHDLDPLYHGEDGVAARLDELDAGGGFAALEELRSAGAVGAIGAGINELGMIPRFLERLDLDLFVVAMPYTLLDQEALDVELPACSARGVGVVVGAPFASGVLATGPNAEAKYAYATPPADVTARVERIRGIAAAFDVSLIGAALQFPLGHPSVCAVIPGATAADQIVQNTEAFARAIPPDFWEALRDQGLIRADAPLPA